MKPLGVGVGSRRGWGYATAGLGNRGGGGEGGEMKQDWARVGWVLSRWMLG